MKLSALAVAVAWGFFGLTWGMSQPAHAANPTNREIVRVYADFYLGQDQPAEAARELEAHLAADPEDGGARHLLGLSYLQDHKPAKAAAAFERAASQVPVDAKGLSLYCQADALNRAGDSAGARRALELASQEPVSARSARRALEADLPAGAELPELEPTYAVRFRARVWAGGAYDSNVLLASNTSLASISRSDVASPRMSLGADAKWQTPGFRGGSLDSFARAHFNAHTAENARAFNDLGAGAGTEWTLKRGPSQMGHSIGDAFGITFLNAGGFGFYSWDNTLRWRGTLEQSYGAETEFTVPIRYQKFAVSSTSDPNDDRTGLAFGAGITRRRSNGTHQFSIGLAAERLFARGDNFRSWTLSLPLGWQRAELTAWKLRPRLNLIPSMVRYPVSATGRKDANLTAILGVDRRFGPGAIGSFEYIFIANPSSVDAATYNKHSFGVKVAYELR